MCCNLHSREAALGYCLLSWVIANGLKQSWMATSVLLSKLGVFLEKLSLKEFEIL